MARPLKPGYRSDKSEGYMLFLTLVKAEEIQSTRQNWIKSRRKSDVSRKNSRSQTPSLLQGKSYNCVETSGGNAIDSKFSDFLFQFNAMPSLLTRYPFYFHFSGLSIPFHDDPRARAV